MIKTTVAVENQTSIFSSKERTKIISNGIGTKTAESEHRERWRNTGGSNKNLAPAIAGGLKWRVARPPPRVTQLNESFPFPVLLTELMQLPPAMWRGRVLHENEQITH